MAQLQSTNKEFERQAQGLESTIDRLGEERDKRIGILFQLGFQIGESEKQLRDMDTGAMVRFTNYAGSLPLGQLTILKSSIVEIWNKKMNHELGMVMIRRFLGRN